MAIISDSCGAFNIGIIPCNNLGSFIVVKYDNHCYSVIMARREFLINIAVNSRKIQKVIIDSHYEAKHKSVIHDELILRLVKSLDGGTYPVQDRRTPYEYYVTDKMELEGKFYKLVWLLEDDQIYIGVVNAYRRR